MHDITEYTNGLTTNQLARLAITTPGNIRVRLCTTGSFYCHLADFYGLLIHWSA